MKNNLLESGQRCNPLEVTKIIQALNYAIDKIGHRTIYEYNSANLDDGVISTTPTSIHMVNKLLKAVLSLLL